MSLVLSRWHDPINIINIVNIVSYLLTSSFYFTTQTRRLTLNFSQSEALTEQRKSESIKPLQQFWYFSHLKWKFQGQVCIVWDMVFKLAGKLKKFPNVKKWEAEIFHSSPYFIFEFILAASEILHCWILHKSEKLISCLEMSDGTWVKMTFMMSLWLRDLIMWHNKLVLLGFCDQHLLKATSCLQLNVT